MPTTSRSYVSGNFALNLDGVQVGFVKSVTGGGVVADVVSEVTGADYYIRKHVGGTRIEPFTIQIGLSMDKTIYDWIESAWQAQTLLRKSGSIVACDYRMDKQSEREFFDALIVETTIPAMDGANTKEAAYLTVTIQPDLVRYKKASGKVRGAQLGQGAQRTWVPSNFRLAIDDLDCTRVSRIDAFTVKLGVTVDQVGELRDVYKAVPGKLDFPNLKITLSEESAQSWIDWHDSFVIKGDNDASKEKNGSLTFLSQNQSTELGRINFFNLGIFRIDFDDDRNSEHINRVTAELYCERMEFKYL